MKIYQIRINDLKNPTIDSLPYLSWKTESEQSAYKIQVTSRKTEELVMDTGYINSPNSLYIPIHANLKPLEEYKVEIFAKDLEDKEMEKGTSYFTTGKLDSKWLGKWIRASFAKDRDEKNQRSSYLRRNFSLKKDIKRATLVISGLGQFYATIDGKKISDDFLPTPYTDYSKQVQYRVYDVKSLLDKDNLKTNETLKNEHTLAVILGNGFYNSTTRDPWQSATAIWKDCPKLLCELHIEYTDDTSDLIVSDESWKGSKGPIIFNQMRHGEHYDGRLFEEGWDLPSFNCNHWPDAKFVRAPGGKLKVMEMEAIKLRERFKPINKWKSTRGWIFDAGKSMAGIINIGLEGKKHSKITIRYSDLVYESGNLNHEELSSFNQDAPFHTDIYIKGSDEREYFACKFTYHGFRYIEVQANYEPSIDDIEILSISNDLEYRSTFTSSDEVVNQIQKITLNASESMFFSLMASDTAREQTSWTGDTGLSVEQLAFNYNSMAFFRNWQQVLRDAQLESGTVSCIVPSAGWGYNSLNGPDWSHPMYEVPTQFYRYYGDTKMIENNFAALSKYCDYLDTMANDGILNYGLGDWCPPFIGKSISVNMESFKCPITVSDTAYYHSALRAAKRNAEILNMPEAAKDFEKRANFVKDAFRREFFQKDTFSVKGDCQTATAMMIFHDLADDDEIPGLVNKLVEQIHENNDRLDFGILGMKAVTNALGQNGHAKLVLKMMTTPGFPSMKYWLDLGATTLRECWNGEGSQNHHMFSPISEFFYKYVAGIYPDRLAKGFDILRFVPPTDLDMDHAKATVDTPFGLSEIHWQKEDNKFTIDLVVPHSIKATLALPLKINNRDILAYLEKTDYTFKLDQKSNKYIVKLNHGKHNFVL